MSRYVKISSVAPPMQTTIGEQGKENAFAGLKDHICSNLLKVLCERPDLVLLPEVIGMPKINAAGAKSYRDGDDLILIEAISALAREYEVNILYPSIVYDDGHLFNSLSLFDRKGDITGRYDKVYPTIGEVEDWGITPGKWPKLLESDIGTIAGVICFDLNFEKLKKHYASLKPDIIAFSSMYHGGIAQAQWAYECRAHFVGSVFGLPSGVLLPTGEPISMSTNYLCYSTALANLDGGLFHLDYNWERIDKAKQKYGSAITVQDPGCLGSVYISVETSDFCIDQLIEEFELERLDDYFARAGKIIDNYRI